MSAVATASIAAVRLFPQAPAAGEHAAQGRGAMDLELAGVRLVAEVAEELLLVNPELGRHRRPPHRPLRPAIHLTPGGLLDSKHCSSSSWSSPKAVDSRPRNRATSGQPSDKNRSRTVS